MNTKIAAFSVLNMKKRAFFALSTANQGNTSFKISSLRFNTTNSYSTIRGGFRCGNEVIKNLDDAISLFDELIRMKPQPPTPHYSNLLNIVVKMKHHEQTIMMFKKLNLLGCPTDEYTMNIVINCYSHLKQGDLGFGILANLLKRGYAPNIVTITTLLKGLFEEDKVEKAQELFKKLVIHNLCEINEITCSTVLNGLCKSETQLSVRIADLGSSIQLDPHEEDGILSQAIRSGVAKYVSMDLCNKTHVLKGLEGAEVVFHMAAPNSSINSYKLHHSVNVQGTQNVIDACVELKVKRLIYTSSPSVVSDGVHAIFNGDESLPYPAKHNDTYSATKAEGEALVLKSNGKNGLLTCCIRPSSIFGPGDRLLVPSLVTAARAGKSKFIIGNGNNVYDFTYVENVVHAHICAERALASDGIVAEKAAGQAYFITNTDPIKFWEFVSRILEGLGYERPRIKISAFVLMPIAYIVELVYKLFGPFGMKVPQLTPSRIRLISQSRTFNCSKANDRLGYTPIVPLQEGIRRTIDSYQHLRAGLQSKKEDSGLQSKKDDSSKASKQHAEGGVVDASHWRNKWKNLKMMLFLVAFYFHFVASGYTIVTAVAKLLLVATVFLFINGILPQKFGYKIEKIHESRFHVSEDMLREVVRLITFGWNSAISGLTSLCKGNDWTLFFKVVFFLSVIIFLGAISFHTLLVLVLPTAVVALVVYEMKGDEIDRLVIKLGGKLKSIITTRSFDAKKEE